MSAFRKALTLAVVLFAVRSHVVNAQSTFGSIVGTVRDASGAVVADASVRIQNLNENTIRELKSSADGNYEALNLKPASYSVAVSHAGFQSYVATDVELVARQTVRVDAALKVGQLEQAVTVESAAGVIASETQTIASSLDTSKVLNLPANFRASGNTSPYRLIGLLPGVQSDNGDAFSIQGALPAQSQASVDGITTQHPRNNAPIRDAFPSAESISEIKVQGVGNSAEYGGVGDITTVSKSGSNVYHGSAFWYHQNRALDARAYGSVVKPQKVANDFGFSLGGPVLIPKVYKGVNRSFFFVAVEDFRYPQGATIQNTVPTDAMRRGDFSAEPGPLLKDPFNNFQPFANNQIPQSRISPIAQKFLTLYPLPNFGSGRVVASPNFITNGRADKPSFQWDLRGDHYITSKQSVFVRWTQKDIDQNSPNNLGLPPTVATIRDRSFIVSHNYTISARWLNEFRLGYSLENPSQNFGFDGKAFATSLGLKDVGPFLFNGLPDLAIDNFTGIGVDRVESNETYRTLTINNNTTWVKGKHTIKFGVDVRAMRSKTALGFVGADNYGNYGFSGTFSGNSFADFLLGAPSNSSYGNVSSDNDGRSNHYHAYIQDSFRVAPKLTLEYGLRYELHPPFQDQSGNIGNFDRTVPKTGRVIYPSSPQAAKLLAPGLLLSVNACPGTPNLPASSAPGLPGVPCTPFVTAAEAGLPEGLRINYKANFFPRFGFAYRPFADSNTVIRGGFGMFNMAILGSVFYSLTGTAQTDVRTFDNVGANGVPLFTWPNSRPSGSSGVSADAYGNSYFGTANAIDFRNPYSMQFNLSVDRNLGFSTGLRVSYIGLRSIHLPYAPNLNQSYYSTEFYSKQPLQSRPFPYWGRIESRDTGGTATYHSLQTELSHRYKDGLTLNAAYTLAHNLADTYGPQPNGFGGETSGGGSRVMDSLSRAGSRGNDYATRRHRFISTAVYELPFGKGRHFMANANRLVDAVLGGWQLGSILLLQTGPYMTPGYGSGVGDPSGTGSGNYRSQRLDRLTGSGVPGNQNRDNWIDKNAFVCPGRAPGPNQFDCRVGRNPATDPAPIGRFGNSGVGFITGPGTVNLSASLGKYFAITERARLRLSGSFTNVPNHVNLADPNLTFTSGSFGKITQARGADFGGNRTGEVSARFEF
jgi:hypothetical protein